MEIQVQIAKASVCIVTYNQEKYIRECLQSIVDQNTDFCFEVIVSDDCSTDGTCSILQEFAETYPCLIRVVFHKENIGPFKNFVSTHNLATGQFVAHCDGDDLFLPGKLQKQVNFLETNLSCTVVWHRVNLFDDLGNHFPGKEADYSMFNHGIVTIEKAIRLGSVAAHSSIMYRKNARKTNSPSFDTLDLFYSWEYLCSGWGIILDDVLGEYRVNSLGAITKSPHSRIKLLYAHHANYYSKQYPKYRRHIFFFALANCIIDIKNFRRSAIKFLYLAINTFTLINPIDFLLHLKDLRKLQAPPLRPENEGRDLEVANAK